jgi:hypothetical protein
MTAVLILAGLVALTPAVLLIWGLEDPNHEEGPGNRRPRPVRLFNPNRRVHHLGVVTKGGF